MTKHWQGLTFLEMHTVKLNWNAADPEPMFTRFPPQCQLTQYCGLFSVMIILRFYIKFYENLLSRLKMTHNLFLIGELIFHNYLDTLLHDQPTPAKDEDYAWKVHTLRTKMNGLNPEELKKIILEAVLDLPANHQSPFSPIFSLEG